MNKVIAFLLIIYIYCFQFNLPIPVRYLLIGIAILYLFLLRRNKMVLTSTIRQMVIIAVISLLGCIYSNNFGEAFRYFLVQAVVVLVMMVLSKNSKHQYFLKKMVYVFSFFSFIGILLQYLFPIPFSVVMTMTLRNDCLEEFIRAYNDNGAFAGWSAYTAYSAFYSAIIIGFITNYLLEKGRNTNIVIRIVLVCVIFLCAFSILLTSKRGVIVASFCAILLIVFLKTKLTISSLIIFLLIGFLGYSLFNYLVENNEFITAVFGRFTDKDNFYSDRDLITGDLINRILSTNILWGHGTASVYQLYPGGAHNIYIQILYENGVIGLIAYMIFFFNNLKKSYKVKDAMAVFVQTLFLVYGLVGNPLYGSNLLLIYACFLTYQNCYYENRNINIP